MYSLGFVVGNAVLSVDGAAEVFFQVRSCAVRLLGLGFWGSGSLGTVFVALLLSLFLVPVFLTWLCRIELLQFRGPEELQSTGWQLPFCFFSGVLCILRFL